MFIRHLADRIIELLSLLLSPKLPILQMRQCLPKYHCVSVNHVRLYFVPLVSLIIGWTNFLCGFLVIYSVLYGKL